jgi:trimeric autotransporter adhesin
LSYPLGVTIDSSGNIFIADYDNNRIRMVTKSTGIITTVAGDVTSGYSGDGGLATSAIFSDPRGVAFDVSGNIYIFVYRW